MSKVDNMVGLAPPLPGLPQSRRSRKSRYRQESVDGSIRPALVYEPIDGGIRAKLDLPPSGSIFVVFNNKGFAGSIESIVNQDGNADSAVGAWEVLDVDENSAKIEFWKNGEWLVSVRSLYLDLGDFYGSTRSRSECQLLWLFIHPDTNFIVPLLFGVVQ